ncbi:MAG TPA: YHS domain-containing protein [Actinomycetota bacterium]|jgi:YHS domain-containing protein|nr:YHS domain-containing protein [Actinomycetota bacterium]
MAFDPICGMEVDQDRWPLRYADTTYWFCSSTCRDEFQRAPRMLVALGPKMAAHLEPQRLAEPGRLAVT